MKIRPALPQDLPNILNLYNDAILHTTSVYEYEPFTNEYIEQWFNKKMVHDFPVLIAESDDDFLGFASYDTFRQRTAYKTTMEHSVYVDGKFRGKGIGKALLEAITGEAQKKNIHVLIGGIDAANLGSIAFHRSCGFSEVGRLPEVAFKFGQWLDLVFMQKIL